MIRRTACLAACALATGLATAVVPAATAVAPPVPDVSSRPVAKALALPGVTARAVTVTLVSGERLRLHREDGGRYTVTQLGTRKAGDARLFVQAREHAGTEPTITAVPTYARALVGTGVVDTHLFDLGYLAAHGLAGGAVPVVVRFDSARSAAVVAQDAQQLPGSNYVAGTATADQATVRVDPGAGASFWNAVTRTVPADPTTVTGRVWAGNPNAPRRLASGLDSLRLAGAPAVVTRPLAPASYTLTVQVHGFVDRSRWLYLSEVFELEYAYLLGVTGPDAGTPLDPVGEACNQDSTCDTLLLTFRAPAGVYSFGSAYAVGDQGRFAEVLGYRPQVDLHQDTTITLDANESSFTSLTGPRASEAAYDAATSVRDLPDGTKLSDLIGLGTNESAYTAGAWVIPAPRVTVGSYHFELDLISQQPLLRAKVVGHPDITLSPLYQSSTGTYDELANEALYPYYRFPAGTHSYPVVDVGYGATSSFAGKDVAGKLALIHINPAIQRYGCTATFGPLRAAIAAHAAGVVYDPTNPRVVNTEGCLTPFDGEWQHYYRKPEPDIPWMTVLPDQAQAIEAQLRTGPVALSITAIDTVRYIYEASANFTGGIPASVSQHLDDSNSIEHVSVIHSTGPAAPTLTPTGSRPDDNLLYAPEFGNWRSDGAPYTVTERLGPAAPDYYFAHLWDDSIGSSIFQEDQLRLDGSYPARTDYNELPRTFGATLPDPRAQRLVPLVGSVYCAFCRQGDTLYPIVVDVSGAAPQTLQAGAYFPTGRLTRDGVRIPFDGGGGLPSYPLPTSAGNYVFTASGSDADLRWTFHSQAPTKTTRPIGTICLGTIAGTSTAPCAASPLVFVRYDAPVDLHNAAPAGASQTVEVTGYHQDPSAPAITRLSVAVSTDGGTTWSPASMRHLSGGRYTATFDVPPLADTDGAVSLRVSAADADGNSTRQTYYDSYDLR